MQEEELLRGDEFEIRLAKLTPYHDKDDDKDKISLALWMQNDSSETMNFYFDRFSVNGTRVLYNDDWTSPSFDLRDHSIEIGFLHVPALPDPGRERPSLAPEVTARGLMAALRCLAAFLG